MDLVCGFCFIDDQVSAISNGSCLQASRDNLWVSMSGRCNLHDFPGKMTWAYDLYHIHGCRRSALENILKQIRFCKSLRFTTEIIKMLPNGSKSKWVLN